MDRDYCQKIKCGIIPQSEVPLEDLYACAIEYGPGVLWPCHKDCKQYGKCNQPVFTTDPHYTPPVPETPVPPEPWKRHGRFVPRVPAMAVSDALMVYFKLGRKT